MTTLPAELIDELSPEQKASMHAAKYRDTQICRSEGDAGAWFLQVEDQIHKYLIKAGVGQRGQRNDIIAQIAPVEGKTLRTAYSCDYAGYCEIWDDLSVAYDSYMENKQMANATRLAEQIGKEEEQKLIVALNDYWMETLKELQLDPKTKINEALKVSTGMYVRTNGKHSLDLAKLAIKNWIFDAHLDEQAADAPSTPAPNAESELDKYFPRPGKSAPKTHEKDWRDEEGDRDWFFKKLTAECTLYGITEKDDKKSVYLNAHTVTSFYEITSPTADEALTVCKKWLKNNKISITDGYPTIGDALGDKEYQKAIGYPTYAAARMDGKSHDEIVDKINQYIASIQDAPQSHQNADNPISDVIPHRDTIVDAPAAPVAARAPIVYPSVTTGTNCMCEAAIVVLFSMFTPTNLEMKFTLRAMSATELAEQMDDMYAVFSKRGYTAQRKQAEAPAQPVTQQLAQHQAALPNQPLAQLANAGVYTSTCALIKGSMTQKGAPMCELHDDGGPHPIRVPGAIPKQLEKLKNVTKSTGQPFTADDLANGRMNGGAWLVDWKYSDDGNYRNLVAVRPA